MNTDNYVLEALEMVTAWDLPDEALADAISDRASLMAGIPPDDLVDPNMA